MTFVLFLLLIFVVLPWLVRIGLQLFVANRVSGMRSAMADAQRRAQQEQSAREKKYARTDGDYADFEEVTDTIIPNEPAPDSQTYTESQISDAEFEEIK